VLLLLQGGEAASELLRSVRPGAVLTLDGRVQIHT